VIRWYADNSELQGIWDAAIPDILLYGGICFENDTQKRLREIMRAVKSEYNEDADFPLKWDFRDLRDYYRNQGREQLFDRLLQLSRQWRTRIFREIASVEFTIIMSIIHGYGRERNVQRRTRERLTRYVFSNALKRLGIHISETGRPYTELVLDWPPGGDRSIFNDEYRCAYTQGRDSEQREYYCGALKNIGFADSPFYSTMTECALLQVSDLIVGAMRGLVNYSLGRTRGSYGLNRVREIKARFRGAPGRVIGRGISIAPPRGELFDRVSKTVENLYGVL